MADKYAPKFTPPAGSDPMAFAPNANPAGEDAAAMAATRGGAKWYGFFSIEKFCASSPLSLTHDDAKGFYDYIQQFSNKANFWYQDGGVAVWAYYEQFDNWQDTYGADAVAVTYHSGHGGMDNAGVFYVPMGADWGGLGCTATSTNMRLGNETLRYLFWSTCLSLRVKGGHSPIRTWHNANLGMRMIFGFETVSIDHAGYGKFFFQEWNKNKSFTRAWLDASWRIYHGQEPSVVAMGANQAEATARLNNERVFSKAAAARNWYQWMWYNASASARQALTTMPVKPQSALLAPVGAAMSTRDLADRFGVGESGVEGARSLVTDAAGGFSGKLAETNFENTDPLSMRQARAAAEAIVAEYGLAQGVDLVLDRVVHAATAGGTDKGSGERSATQTLETILQYRQTIGGVPVIAPDAGTLRVAIDNDGAVTRIDGALRQVDRLDDSGRFSQPTPDARTGDRSGGFREPSPLADEPVEAALAQATGALLGKLMGSGRAPAGYEVHPGSTEVGYVFEGDVARLVATRVIEVDHGNGYRKLHRVTTPLDY